MVLLLRDEQDAPSSLQDIYEACPALHEAAKSLASRPPLSLGPNGVKYVRQKGFAVCTPGETLSDGKGILSLGTEDVLTCHVVVLKQHPVTALGHFDEYVTPRILDTMISLFEEKVRGGEDVWDESDEWEWEEWDEKSQDEDMDSSPPIDFSSRTAPISLGMVGGYSDEAGKAGRLRQRLLEYFAAHPYTFRIDELCLGDVNTRQGMYRKEPIIGGVAVDLKSGRLHKATFNSRAFLKDMSDGMVNKLLLGPSLIKKPNALKRIILEKEDQGYSI